MAQRRLYTLRTIVMPEVCHEFAFGNGMLGTLKCVKKKVRGAVRRWLNLPHDVPSAYVHAPITERGLLILTIVHVLRKKSNLSFLLDNDQILYILCASRNKRFFKAKCNNKIMSKIRM